MALKTKSKNKSEFWESGRNDACGPILDMSRGFEYAFHKGSTRVLESEKNVFGVWVSTQLEDPCAETVSQELKVVMDADKSTIHDKTVNNNVNDYNETIDSIRKVRIVVHLRVEYLRLTETTHINEGFNSIASD